MTTTSKQAPERHEIEALLPWHAAGTLSQRDAQRVEQALADDRELAQHYELVREELGETIHLNETLGAPSARAMQRLMAAIDADGARRPRASLDLVGRIGGFFSGFAPRTLAWSAAAAALAIVVQAGLLATVFVGEQQGGLFQTASYQQEVSTREGSFAVVRFAPQATAADITKFLNAYKVSVVDGPRPGGLYRVRLAMTGMPKDQLGKIIKQMQAETTVVGFVAAAD
jgi:anti-sigma factor RsiW